MKIFNFFLIFWIDENVLMIIHKIIHIKIQFPIFTTFTINILVYQYVPNFNKLINRWNMIDIIYIKSLNTTSYYFNICFQLTVELLLQAPRITWTNTSYLTVRSMYADIPWKIGCAFSRWGNKIPGKSPTVFVPQHFNSFLRLRLKVSWLC